MPQGLQRAPIGSSVASGQGTALQMVRDRFQRWLFEQALPFWATTGCDGTPSHPAMRGAQESLTLAGVPALPPFKRVRVQARQLFVFSWASLQGWKQAEACAAGIFDFLLKARTPDGGWVCRLTPEGSVLDATADLYDLAFVVFALAWYGRLDKSGHAVALARETLCWIQAHMGAPTGGFFNTLPQKDAPRQQNPHMHLLEAVLALYETTRDTAALAMAHDLYALFSTRFQDAETGILGEFFTENWQPAPGEAGNWVEPGHHFEWVWLLHEYTRWSGVQTAHQSQRLYTFALQHGVNVHTAFAYDGIGRDGAVLKASSRLWVQGEALRGVLTVNPQDTADHLAARMADTLLTRYFIGCPEGTWLDQLDAASQPAVTAIPTSSLYHIVTAFEALDQAASRL